MAVEKGKLMLDENTTLHPETSADITLFNDAKTVQEWRDHLESLGQVRHAVRLDSSENLNNVLTTGNYWVRNDTQALSLNYPEQLVNASALFLVFTEGVGPAQFVTQWWINQEGGVLYVRHTDNGSLWTPWVAIGGGDNCCDELLDDDGIIKYEKLPPRLYKFRGFFSKAADLAAITDPVSGDFVTVGETGTVWQFDGETNSWIDSRMQGLVTSVNGKTGEVVIALADFGITITASVINGLPARVDTLRNDFAALKADWNKLRVIDGVTDTRTNNISHEVTCNTAANVRDKEVTFPGMSLVNGAQLIIRFVNGNTAAKMRLVVRDGTGVDTINPRTVRYRGLDIPEDAIKKQGVYKFVYESGNWYYVGDFDTTAAATPVIDCVNKLCNVRKIDGGDFDGSKDMHHYYQCGSDKAQQWKDVVYPSSTPVIGAVLDVRFTQTNEASNVKIRLNSDPTTDKFMRYKGAYVSGPLIRTGYTYRFVFDGSFWQLEGIWEFTPVSVYGVSNTAAAVAAKTVSISGFERKYGACIYLSFNKTDTSTGAPTLNVSGTGAFPLIHNGVAFHPKKDRVYTVIFNNISWLVANSGSDV